MSTQQIIDCWQNGVEPYKVQEIEWNCPYCGFMNVDLKGETAVPMCGDCLKDVNWWEISSV